MSFLSALSAPSPAAALFVPSDRFFLRLVPLAPELPAADQAQLALDGSAPFPPAQLYWGCCVSPDRTQALVYAAHRRRFSAEEVKAWDRAGLVVPSIVVLCGASPAKGPCVCVVEEGNALHGAVWAENATWPAHVQARSHAEKPDAAALEKFAAELAAKAGVSDARVLHVTATPTARWEDDRLIFEQQNGASLIKGPAMAKADADALDVREREFLLKHREEKRRGALIWKLMLAGGAAAVLALLCELGALGFMVVTKMQDARAKEREPLVQRLDVANALVNRVDELTQKRLRYFEMLTFVNDRRPASIQFSRTSNNGRSGLDIEAQTTNAGDVGTFENALRSTAEIQSATSSESRTREGVTTFTLKVAFKADFTAAPPQPPAVVTGGAQ
ncbi:hypothetical protein [Oleiharenicola lentus]|uniref:hypothetical protein n=1 Tax=Oleiharenicola lentus TaxID=2508720 RepID=UPI003F6738F4